MFVSKKKLKNNNDILFKRNTELNKFCIELQQQVSKLNNTNKDLMNQIMILDDKLVEKKKECKKLKTLLTKNNIEYKKEN